MRSSKKTTLEGGKRKDSPLRQEIRLIYSVIRRVWMALFLTLPLDGIVAATRSRIALSASTLESLGTASVLLLLASVILLHPERTIGGLRELFGPFIKRRGKLSPRYRAALIVALVALVAFLEVGTRIASFGVGPAIMAAVFVLLGAAKLFSTVAKVTPHTSILQQLALINIISPILARSGAVCALLAYIGGALSDYEYAVILIVAAALVYAGKPTSELFLERCPQCLRLSPRTGFVSVLCEQCKPSITSNEFEKR